VKDDVFMEGGDVVDDEGSGGLNPSFERVEAEG
jgi:hypothetical protein